MKSAFTLIEMLVVIAIIGILAAMLSGPISDALNTSYQTSCLNNLRQIGFGLHTYVNENEHFPTATNMVSQGLNTLPSISAALAVQVPKETFKCPGDDKGYYENEESSYEWAQRLNEKTASIKNWRGETMDPSDVWVLRDYEAFHGDEDSEVGRNILYYDNTGNGL